MSEAVSLQTPAIKGGEFLTFRLGTDEFGIDILRVQEIRAYEAPTNIAGAPEFLRGVVNLRGVVVPVVDLRLWFQRANAELNALTVVIVLNARGRIIGVVVDSVSDVVEFSESQIGPVPELGIGIRHASGWATTEIGTGKVSIPRGIILLDIEALLGDPELGLVRTQPPQPHDKGDGY